MTFRTQSIFHCIIAGLINVRKMESWHDLHFHACSKVPDWFLRNQRACQGLRTLLIRLVKIEIDTESSDYQHNSNKRFVTRQPLPYVRTGNVCHCCHDNGLLGVLLPRRSLHLARDLISVVGLLTTWALLHCSLVCVVLSVKGTSPFSFVWTLGRKLLLCLVEISALLINDLNSKGSGERGLKREVCSFLDLFNVCEENDGFHSQCGKGDHTFDLKGKKNIC